MKKTRTFLALFLALALCLALFAGCGSSSSSSSSSSSGSTSSGSTSSDATTSEDSSTVEAGTGDYTTIKLTVVNHDSPDCMGEHWLETVLGYVTEETGGAVTFDYYAGGSMFGATETIDAVKDGAADICWWTTGSYSGRFLVSEFINLVGNGIDNAQEASAVINTMYNEMPEVQDEYTDWHILCLHGTSCSPICTVNKKIETASDLSGLRLRVAGTVPSAYLTALGATPVSLPTSDVYDNLEKNAIDGMCNDWHNIDCFNLYEPINYCLNVSLNMTVSGVFMNQDVYDSLTPDTQAVFDKYFASGYAADMAGYWWDSCRYWVGDEMLDNGVEIYDPSDEVEEFLFSDDVLNTAAETYIDLLNQAGYDGQALYDQCMEIVSRYASDYANVWDSEFNYADWDVSADGYTPVWG